jgi:hypothetical protein
MAVDRVSTYGLYQTTLGDITKVSSVLGNLQVQVASGFKSSEFCRHFR